MILTVYKLDVKGKNDIKVFHKDKIIYEKENMSIEEIINIPDEFKNYIRIEITFTAPKFVTSKERFRHFLKMVLYHIVPVKKDPEIYGYKARLCCKKIFLINNGLVGDATLDYVPYQESKFTYDKDNTFVRDIQYEEYPYSYIPHLAFIFGKILILLILILIVYINYLWIRTLYY